MAPITRGQTSSVRKTRQQGNHSPYQAAQFTTLKEEREYLEVILADLDGVYAEFIRNFEDEAARQATIYEASCAMDNLFDEYATQLQDQSLSERDRTALERERTAKMRGLFEPLGKYGSVWRPKGKPIIFSQAFKDFYKAQQESLGRKQENRVEVRINETPITVITGNNDTPPIQTSEREPVTGSASLTRTPHDTAQADISPTIRRLEADLDATFATSMEKLMESAPPKETQAALKDEDDQLSSTSDTVYLSDTYIQIKGELRKEFQQQLQEALDNERSTSQMQIQEMISQEVGKKTQEVQQLQDELAKLKEATSQAQRVQAAIEATMEKCKHDLNTHLFQERESWKTSIKSMTEEITNTVIFSKATTLEKQKFAFIREAKNEVREEMESLLKNHQNQMREQLEEGFNTATQLVDQITITAGQSAKQNADEILDETIDELHNRIKDEVSTQTSKKLKLKIDEMMEDMINEKFHQMKQSMEAKLLNKTKLLIEDLTIARELEGVEFAERVSREKDNLNNHAKNMMKKIAKAAEDEVQKVKDDVNLVAGPQLAKMAYHPRNLNTSGANDEGAYDGATEPEAETEITSNRTPWTPTPAAQRNSNQPAQAARNPYQQEVGQHNLPSGFDRAKVCDWIKEFATRMPAIRYTTPLTREESVIMYDNLVSKLKQLRLPIRTFDELRKEHGNCKPSGSDPTYGLSNMDYLADVLAIHIRQLISPNDDDLKAILTSPATRKDGFKLLFDIMARLHPHLQAYPMAYGPAWPETMDIATYQRTFQLFLDDEYRSWGRNRPYREQVINVLTHAKKHSQYHVAAVNFLTMLLQPGVAQDITGTFPDLTALFNTLGQYRNPIFDLELSSQNPPNINRFQNDRPQGDRPPPRRFDRGNQRRNYTNPVQCGLCKRFGHCCITQDQVCRLGAQVYWINTALGIEIKPTKIPVEKLKSNADKYAVSNSTEKLNAMIKTMKSTPLFNREEFNAMTDDERYTTAMDFLEAMDEGTGSSQELSPDFP